MALSPCQPGYQLNPQGACVPMGQFSELGLYILMAIGIGGLLLAWWLGREK